MKNINRADKNLIKKINTLAILQVIRDSVSVSRADIAKKLGQSSATVSSNVSDLIDKGLVRETGIGESSGGRKPILLELDINRNYILGIYIDAAKVTAGLVSINGQVIRKKEVPLGIDKGFQTIANIVQSAAYDLFLEMPDDRHKVLGVGMGVHGVVDSLQGISVFAPAFNWHNINLKQYFEEVFPFPIIIDNDVRAMVLGEKWFGGAVECDNFVLLNIDSGIGSAIFLNGDVYRGAGFGAGEIGHIHITHAPIPCSCGKYGCLETVASSTAIIKIFKETTKVQDNINIITIYEKALAGNTAAFKVLDDAGRHVGKAASIVINILNPRKILLTGEVSSASTIILDAITKEIYQSAMESNIKNLTIENARFGENLGIIGAATLVISEIYSINGLCRW